VNKHLTSLLVKFIMIGLISVIILPLFAQISSGQAILIAVVLTVVAYLLGDRMVLPRYGNTTATVLDVVLAAVVIGLSDWMINGFVTLTPAGWVLFLGVLAIGEWLFHKYLKTSPVRVGDAKEE
jgi:predicted ABC-type exoprotein transport system permease subunit